MNDIKMLDAVERYIRGEMEPGDRFMMYNDRTKTVLEITGPHYRKDQKGFTKIYQDTIADAGNIETHLTKTFVIFLRNKNTIQ